MGGNDYSLAAISVAWSCAVLLATSCAGVLSPFDFWAIGSRIQGKYSFGEARVMNKPMNDPKGSLWRKWDLHLHGPGTKKNDQYKTNAGDVLDAFCDRLEASDVAAFGITDYFSADSYFAFIKRFNERHPHSTKIFFPNVELCTNDVVNAASEEVNLHIIFNPFVPNYESAIKKFLQQLDTNKTGSGNKKIKASELKMADDFQSATTTRDQIVKAINEVFGPTIERTEHLLIFTAVNNDGIRAARGKKRKALIADELDKFSDGFFGNSGNTQYFLNSRRLEDGLITDPKPVISGSDAHSFNELDNWLGRVVLKDGKPVKESTWIKSDVTFEGLKQILFEPSDRVFIGEEPEIETRVRDNRRRYISSLEIDQADGYDGRYGTWFKSEKITLGKELIAIIGNKGNGKSAVTDIMGLLGNSHNQKYDREGKKEELFSFLNREKFLKANCASNFTAQLHWYAGAPDKVRLDADTDTDVPERVEYLPQKYLEKICANIEDDEFRHKLNEVIFEYVREGDRYKQRTLDDLIHYLTNQTAADIETAKSHLHEVNEAIVALERRLVPDYQKDVEDKLRLKQADLNAHVDAKPKEVPAPVQGGEAVAKDAARIKEIDEKTAELQKIIRDYQQESGTLSRSAEDLKQARQAIDRQVAAVTNLKVKYDALLATEGLHFDDIVSVKTSYDKLDAVIEQKRSRIHELTELSNTETDITALGLSEMEEQKAKEKSLACQLAALQRSRKEITDSLDKPNREYQAYLAALAQWQVRQQELEGDPQNPGTDTLNWLKQELETITTRLPAELQAKKIERNEGSATIFAKKKSLVAFYDEVKRSIDEQIGKYGADLHDYHISIEASLKFDQVFYDEFFRYLNQQVKGSFHGTDDGRGLLKQLTGVISNWENVDEVFEFLESVDAHLHEDKRPGQGEDTARDIFKQLRQKKDPVGLYDFLYGFDYLETKYDLKIDGKDLRELSPGERGGLLLIFYLMLDRRDIPLVIDQPEDNLDNKSVYEILVTFLKKAKKRRQIIIVTHNPNLAVVADAEQIIHVTIDKTKSLNDFAFESGAIENPRINKAVVDILEGTLPAFDNRRLKYRRQT
ncbi:MAG: AAA family ATPase [Acidobacteriia bacterium]|nr:AAA family ATPase [Terriglobia bacterium]